jgi:hypothetical protein
MTLYDGSFPDGNWNPCSCTASVVYHELLHNVGLSHPGKRSEGRSQWDRFYGMQERCLSNLCGVNEWPNWGKR